MPTTDVGVTLDSIARRSLLKRRRDRVSKPQAATVNKFVASVTPNGMPNGTVLTLQAGIATSLLRYGRRATVSVTDNAFASPLSVSVLVKGFLRGVPQEELITATSVSTSIQTVSGTKFFDQIVSATAVTIANAAASDALQVGMDGTGFALECRIKSIADVKSIINVANGVEATPTAISAATVNIVDSAITGITIAATDDWEVQYFATGDDGVNENGAVA